MDGLGRVKLKAMVKPSQLMKPSQSIRYCAPISWQNQVLGASAIHFRKAIAVWNLSGIERREAGRWRKSGA
jgi:hypothetical protein